MENKKHFRIRGNCYNFIRCNDLECPVRKENVQKCWEYLEAHPEVAKKHYCNREVDCDDCHYKKGWVLGLINPSHFDTYLEADDYGDISEGMEQPISKKEGAVTNPFRCFNMTNCQHKDCTVRRKGIVKCWEHWEGMTNENILKYRGHDFDCNKCHYRQGWLSGLLNEKLFVDELQKQKKLQQKLKQIRVEKFFAGYLKVIEERGKMSREEEVRLAQRIAGGDDKAAELLIEANYKLVANMAKKLVGRSGMEFSDLFHEGAFGLVKALSKFDSSLGNRFSTYASFWIRQSMLSALATRNRVIYVPTKVLVMGNKIQKTVDGLKKRGEEPTLRALSQMLNLKEDEILEIIHVTRLPFSIEEKKDANSGASRVFLIPSENIGPEEQIIQDSKKQAINEAIEKNLTPREQQVVSLHFGLNENEGMSLAEIGRQLGISRERSRQLLNQGIGKLKSGYFGTQLQEFLH